MRVATRLLHCGADVNRLDGEGNTPLHRSLMHGPPSLLPLLELLLDRGADINARNRAGATPLDLALQPPWTAANPAAVELLQRRGAQRGGAN